MRSQRHSVSRAKHLQIKDEVDRAAIQGAIVPAAELVRRARTTETFLYRHERTPCDHCVQLFGSGPATYLRRAMDSVLDARKGRLVDAATGEAITLRAELANAEASNQRLHRQVRALEQRLSEVTGDRTVSDMFDVLGPPALPADDDARRALERRVRSLEEEVAGVRRLNAELTRRLNTR